MATTNNYAATGSPPMIGVCLSIAQWRDYLDGYDFGPIPPTRVVLHHTYKPTRETWNGVQSMRGMQTYYAGLGWSSAPHIYVAEDGIWLFTPLSQIGIHAGTGNGSVRQGWYSIGLEVVGYFDHVLPDGKTWDYACEVMAGLSRRLALPMHELLAFHRDYTTDKSCPGWKVHKAWVLAQVEEYRQRVFAATPPTHYVVTTASAIYEMPDAKPTVIAWNGEALLAPGHTFTGTPINETWIHRNDGNGFVLQSVVGNEAVPRAIAAAPESDRYSEDSPLVGAPKASREACVAEILAHKSPMVSERFVRDVFVAAYWRWCVPLGIDPVLAISQALHECMSNGHHLHSFWFLYGRNPCGYEVNGENRLTPPDNPLSLAGSMPGWAYNWQRKQWERGMTFESYDTDNLVTEPFRAAGIVAHVGRLGAYRFGERDLADDATLATAERERRAQARNVIAYGLHWRTLPPTLRGSVTTLKHLGKAHNPTGEGWANPGTRYGSHIAAHAERIREHTGG